MTAVFRRPSRLLAVFGAVCILYVLVIAIPKPKQPEVVFEYVKGGYDWSTLQQRHPVPSLTPLPRGTPRKLPKVQHDFSSGKTRPNKTRLAVLAERRSAVRTAFKKSWISYKNYAWMHDELEPVTGGNKDPFGGWAATMVDSMDTLWIMDSEYILK
jgi:mannosyl-oligosaccharide alpha-1,2-mannosidase